MLKSPQQQSAHCITLLEKFNIAGALPLDILKWLNAILISDPVIDPPIDIIGTTPEQFQKVGAGFKKLFDNSVTLRIDAGLSHHILSLLSLYLTFTLFCHRMLPKHSNKHTKEKLFFLNSLDTQFFNILYEEIGLLNSIKLSSIEVIREDHHLILQIHACLFDFFLIIYKNQQIPRMTSLNNSLSINNAVISHCKMHVNLENLKGNTGRVLNADERMMNTVFHLNFKNSEYFFLRSVRTPSEVKFIDPETGFSCNFYLGAIHTPHVMIDTNCDSYQLSQNYHHFSQSIKAILLENRIHITLDFSSDYGIKIRQLAYLFTIPHISNFAKSFVALMRVRRQLRNLISEAIKYKNKIRDNAETIVSFDEQIQHIINKQYLAKFFGLKRRDDFFGLFYAYMERIDSLKVCICTNEIKIANYLSEIVLKKNNVATLLLTAEDPYTRITLEEEQAVLELYGAELESKIELLVMENTQLNEEIGKNKKLIEDFLKMPHIESLFDTALPLKEIAAFLEKSEPFLNPPKASSSLEEKSKTLLYKGMKNLSLSPTPELAPITAGLKGTRKKKKMKMKS